MTWAKLDDGFFDHPKARAAGKDGRELFLAALCHSARNLTDGFIATTDLPLLAAKAEVNGPRTARRLVDAGWWEAVEGGWLIHDFLIYNPSSEKIRAEREYERRKKDLHSDPALVQAIRRRDRDRCRYCGEVVNWRDRRGPSGATYDHVDPTGPNSYANVVVACRGCNARKGNRTPEGAGMVLLDPPGDSPSDLGPTQVRPSHPSSSRPVPSRPSASDRDVTPASSSSSGDDEDEHATHTLDEAFRLIAERRLDVRNTDVGIRGGQPITGRARREAWIAEDMNRSRELYGRLARAYIEADPELDARQLADALDTPVADTLAGWKPYVDIDA